MKLINNAIIVAALSCISAQSCFTQDKSIAISNDSIIVLNENETNEGIPNWTNSLQILQHKSLIIANCDGIKIWKLQDGIVDTLIRFGDKEYIVELIATHDENKLIAAVNSYNSKKNFICCYSLSNKNLLWKVENVNFKNGLGISVDDSSVYAIGSWNITTVNIRNGKILEKQRKFLKHYLLPNPGGVEVLFSHSGHYVLYWSNAGYKTFNLRFGSRLEVWDMLENKKVSSKFITGKGVWSASFLSDEKSILTGSYDGVIRLYSIEKDRIVKLWQVHGNDRFKELKKNYIVYQMVLPKETENFLGTYGIVNDKWTFKIWRYPIMKAESMLLYPGDCAANFSNDGKLFVVTNNGYLSLYNTTTWQCLWRVLIRNNKGRE